jgi:N-acetylneuraminic acid mutarotase
MKGEIMSRITRRQILLAGAYSAVHAALPQLARGQKPSGGKWEMGPPMPKPMGEVVGVAVNRSLYVFGGLNDAAGEVPYGAAFRFDSERSNWSTLRDMPQPAHHLMASAHDGKIYIFGGFTLGNEPKMSWQPTDGSWEYSPDSNTYKRLAPLPRPRGAGYSVTVHDKIYVIGGVSSSPDGRTAKPIPLATPGGQTVTGFVDEYDPETDTWRQRTPMPTPRNHYLAATLGGKIYALNGRTGSVFVNMASITDLIEMYDPEQDVWTLVGRAPTNRGDVNGAACNGSIYVTGGEYETTKIKESFWAFEAYDPSSQTWETLPHVQIARHGFAAGFIGNTLHVVGGSFQSDGMPGVYSPTATHEVYTVAT